MTTLYRWLFASSADNVINFDILKEAAKLVIADIEAQ